MTHEQEVDRLTNTLTDCAGVEMELMEKRRAKQGVIRSRQVRGLARAFAEQLVIIKRRLDALEKRR